MRLRAELLSALIGSISLITFILSSGTGAEIEKPPGNRGGWWTGNAPDQDRDAANGIRVCRTPRQPPRGPKRRRHSRVKWTFSNRRGWFVAPRLCRRSSSISPQRTNDNSPAVHCWGGGAPELQSVKRTADDRPQTSDSFQPSASRTTNLRS